MHDHGIYALSCAALLSLSCGFFGLNGDESLIDVACTGGSPDLPALSTASSVRERLGVLDPSKLYSDCGGNGNEERAYHFVPPQSGAYDFRVVSDFDAVLYVLDAPCGNSTVIDCEDNSGELGVERLTLDLEEGRSYVVVVDGFSSFSEGDFTLTVSSSSGGGGETDGNDDSDSSSSSSGGDGLDCSGVEKSIELNWDGARWSGSFSGTTGQDGDQFSSECSVALNGTDDAWAFTPPVAGVYRASVQSSGSLSVLSARDTSCTEFACSDGGAGAFLGPSFEVELDDGSYTIVIDGYDGGDPGSYQLAIEQIPESELSPTCRQACVGPGNCGPGEVCLGTTNGQVCLPQLCESCFSAGQTCSSYPRSCEPIGCF